MEESILSCITEKVLGAVISLAVQEVCLVWGLQSDLRRLNITLSGIKAVILDAEEKQTTNHLITHWLRQLKDVLYDAEDVLDDFAYQVLHKKCVKPRPGFNRKVRRFFSSSNPIAYRLRIGHQIKDLRMRLDEIAAEKARLNLVDRLDVGHVQLREREMTHSFVRSSDIIGRDGDRESIVKFLMDSHQGHAGDDNVAVIPIVGIGGLGKTAVAKIVFNDARVLDHFQKKIWVCLGDMKQLDVNGVMEKIGGEMGVSAKSTPEHLQQSIRENLQDKSLLLVLDDVWDVSRDKWLNLKSLLASGSQSRIIVTTRINSVALCVGTVSPYNLPGLPHQDCVSLFTKLAFASKVDERLMKIGEAIVKKCKGVPLAIRSLGSLLFSKSDENEWLSVRDSSIWQLEESEGSILPVLNFSYDRMPSHLKQCFVYCSMFPEDYWFNDRFLISFWMAHGLLQSSKKSQEPEDVGKSYINELLSRGFFQDCREYGTHTLYFKMHDLVRDLACSLGQEEFTNITFNDKSISESVRHLYFQGHEFPAESSNVVRSLLLSGNINGVINACLEKFKYLRVLGLSRSCSELPATIGTLKHLRSLDVSHCNDLTTLPGSICNLYNLQSLNLEGCGNLKEVPEDIGKLINLRYLWITTKQKHLPQKNRIECLPCLQLLVFDSCSDLQTLFEKTGELTSSIRTLNVFYCEKLESLFSQSGSPTVNHSLPALEVLYIFDCPNLDLNYKVRENMKGDGDDSQYLHLPRLRRLVVHGLPMLERIPEWMHGCAANLQFLYLYRCFKLKTLPEWLPQLTSLHTLKIEGSHRLVSLPQGMQRLTALNELTVLKCGALSRRCRIGGEDRPMIAHVPNICTRSDI